MEERIGNVEPKLASRLIRLINGGNRYEATATSVGESEIQIMVNEVFKNPSLSETTSFSAKLASDQKIYTNNTATRYSQSDEDSTGANQIGMKDWSDDDTEPGDDEAYAPTFHRISKSIDDNISNEEHSLEDQERYN